MADPQEIQVLDKGFVKLIDHLGSDLSVVNAARVSYGKRKETQKYFQHAPAER